MAGRTVNRAQIPFHPRCWPGLQRAAVALLSRARFVAFGWGSAVARARPDHSITLMAKGSWTRGQLDFGLRPSDAQVQAVGAVTRRHNCQLLRRFDTRRTVGRQRSDPKTFIQKGRLVMKTALALTAVAALALTVATPAQAMSPAPLHQTDATTTITQVALACGIGRTRVGGVCVSRAAKRHVRRQVRREARWN